MSGDLGIEKLGAEFRLNTATAGRQEIDAVGDSALFPTANGGWVVGYSTHSSAPQGMGAFFKAYDSTGAVTIAETYISPGTFGLAVVPVQLAGGGYVMTYSGVGLGGVFGRLYDAAGTALGGSFSLATSGGGATYTSAAALSGGGFVAAWMTELGIDGSEYDVVARVFSSTGVGGTQFRVNVGTTNRQEVPSVQVLSDGRFVIAWNGNGPGDTSGAFARIFAADGTPATGEFLLNTYTDADQSNLSLAAAANGGFVATWLSRHQDGSGLGVVAQRFDSAGAKVGGEIIVNTVTNGDQYGPQVTHLQDGGFLVVWFDGDGDGFGVYAQRFGADGAKMGGQLLVNTFTAGNQRDANVTTLADGTVLVAWKSDSQDAGQGDIFAQRLSIPLANATPDAVDDTASTPENSGPILIDVLANDTDGNAGDSKTLVSLDTTGTLGTASIVGGQVRFDPGDAFDFLEAGESTTTSFSYTMEDAAGAESSATVTVTVTGVDDMAPAAPVVFDPSGYVLVDADTYEVVGMAEAGALVRIVLDVDGDGVAQAGETVLGSQQLGDGETDFAITVAIAQDGVSRLLAVAEDAAGNVSAAADAGTVEDVSTTSVTHAISAVAAAVREGHAGTTTVQFLVTRSGDLSGGSVTGWQVVGGAGSVDAADFAAGRVPSGLVIFAPGESSKLVSLALAGDTMLEADETLALRLVNPSVGAANDAATASTTILNDEATVSIAALDAVRTEGQSGSTPFTFLLTREGDASVSHRVAWSVAGSGDNAADAADFGSRLPSGTVTFAAGETQKIVTVGVRGDTAMEANEAFQVSISSLSAGLSVLGAPAAGTIISDESRVSIAADAASVREGHASTTAYTFTVSRTGYLGDAATVDYAVAGSGRAAADGVDFAGGVLPTGRVSFSAGEASKTVTLNLRGDRTVEADEAFVVRLQAPSRGMEIETGSARGLIANDDAFLVLDTTTPGPTEGETWSVQVLRTGDVSTAATVDWVVRGTGATPAARADFAGGAWPTGTLSFAAGADSATISFGIADDMLAESAESFILRLFNPGNGLVLSVGSGVFGITDNDLV